MLPRLEKEARINKDKQAGCSPPYRQAQEVLDGGQTVFAAGLDRGPLRELFLLTAKPFLYVFNCDSDELADADAQGAAGARWSRRPRRSSWTPRSSPS